MRVRWIGDARSVSGLGCMPIAGQDYDWPDEVARSLIEQGKAVPAPLPPPVTTKPAKKPVFVEEE